MTRKPYNYGHNGDCACANGYPVMAEGLDVAILRLSTTSGYVLSVGKNFGWMDFCDLNSEWLGCIN